MAPLSSSVAVLNDGTRILTQSSFLRALDRSVRPHGRGSRFEEIAPFLASETLKPYVDKDLAVSSRRIKFAIPGRGQAYGYKAELLPKVCEVYLRARQDGVLMPAQARTAAACEVLLRGLAIVGIIALVDEATSYQEIRDRNALNRILDKYLVAEHAKWAKRFPDEFYKEIFRLRSWQWKGMKVNRPSVVGHYTNDFVWDRLAPGVRKELERINPKNETGRRRAMHHQWLTTDIGHPALQRHLTGVMAIMRGSIEWNHFRRMLQRAYPKTNTNLELDIE